MTGSGLLYREKESSSRKLAQIPWFTGWNEWKTRLREGIDCEVLLRREGGRITVYTENLGISIQCVTKILDETEDVYVALTGDQCAITNIRTGNAG